MHDDQTPTFQKLIGAIIYNAIDILILQSSLWGDHITDIRHKAVNYTKKEFFHLFYTLFVACENSVFFMILMIGPGLCKKISAF